MQMEVADRGTVGVSGGGLLSPQRQVALKERQIAKAVEHVATAPAPTMATLAAELGVSRATAYRIAALPAFQRMLQQALTGRLTIAVQKAFAVIENTMEDGSPSLRLRAAMWMAERHDKLSQLAMTEAAKPRDDLAAADAMAQLRLLIASSKVDRAMPEPLTDRERALKSRLLDVLSSPVGNQATDGEMLDGALENALGGGLDVEGA
jgi:hypothetical protein